MTIREYLNKIDSLQGMKSKDGKSLTDAMMDVNHVWSNSACEGYAIEAMRRAGLDPAQIKACRKEFDGAFEDISILQAEIISQEA